MSRLQRVLPCESKTGAEHGGIGDFGYLISQMTGNLFNYFYPYFSSDRFLTVRICL